MISHTPVGGNDIYAIQRVDCNNAQSNSSSTHYEIYDIFRKKCIAICDDFDEAQKKLNSFFNPPKE